MSGTVESPTEYSDFDDVFADLDRGFEQLPERAIEIAREHRAAITPRLIQCLEQAIAAIQRGEDSRTAAFFALYLLVEFRAAGAGPAIRSLAMLSEDDLTRFLGDSLTEDFSRMLTTFLRSPAELDELIQNPGLNEYVRWEAIQGYLHLVKDGVLSREKAVAGLKTHLVRELELPATTSSGSDDRQATHIAMLISELLDYVPFEAADEIRTAFQRDLVDDSIVSLKCLDDILAKGMAAWESRLLKAESSGIPDCLAEFRTWHCFREPDETRDPADSVELSRMLRAAQARMMGTDDLDPLDFGLDEEYQPEDTLPGITIQYEQPRVGRNDPCPCGSGKKFKKCCGKAPGH